MILKRKVAGRESEPLLESLSARYGLDGVARCVFGGCDEEDAVRAVRAGQALSAANDGHDMADLAVFLIAWGAERITEQRIAAGDLGIDEVACRVAELPRGGAEWRQAVADYAVLADEIFIDTLNEFREFGMVVSYSGQRPEFQRRRAAGRHQLAAFCPDLAAAAMDEVTPLALAG